MNNAVRVEIPENLEKYRPLVTAALSQYELNCPVAVFVRHHENLTFRVTDAMSRSWVMRVHLPTQSSFPPEFRRVKAIESELIWLDALAFETDIVIQRPMRNRARRFVTEVADAGGATIPCTLLGWLEGRTFDPDAPDAEAFANQLGFLVARLHMHSRSWTPPEEFSRPSLDEAALEASLRRLQVAVRAGFITEAEFGAYVDATRHIAGVMRRIGVGPLVWGLIHSDLGPSNVIVRGNDLSPIDFSLSCFAHYLFDVGGCGRVLKSKLRPAFLAGYERIYPLTPEARRDAEAFSMFSQITSFGFFLPNPRRHEWLRHRIPEVAKTYCLQLVRGEPFIFV